jgi:hypothetical protein
MTIHTLRAYEILLPDALDELRIGDDSSREAFDASFLEALIP